MEILKYGGWDMVQTEYKILTIRIPLDLWKRLRRAQEDGKVRSIQDAAIRGMEILLSDKGGE